MKSFLLGSLAVLALAAGGAANAADLPMKAAPLPPPVPVFSWTGFYIGAHVGGHWGEDKLAAEPLNPAVFGGPAGTAEFLAITSGKLKPQGFTGGGQIGYNWQVNNWVLGLEADAAWLDGKASRSVLFTGAVNINPGDIMTNETSARWLSTVRGRVGMTFDRLLVYATGGVAFGEVKTTDTFCVAGCPAVPDVFSAVSASTTRVGWTAGAGLEYALGSNWSIKAEYLYVDLGSFDTTIPACALCVAQNLASEVVVHHKYTDNIARFGVNYRFGGPVVARY